MKLFRLFWRRFLEKINPPKIYTKIETLPLYNWFKIHESNDLSFLIKKGHAMRGRLVKAWELIYDEYIDTFGISDDFREYLDTKRKIAIHQADLIITGDRSLETFIEIEQVKLESLFNRKTKQNINEVKVYVEKYMGFRLDEKTVSVKEYYTYLYALQKQNKRG